MLRTNHTQGTALNFKTCGELRKADNTGIVGCNIWQRFLDLESQTNIDLLS